MANSSVLFANNATTLLASSVTTSATSISVVSSSTFPAPASGATYFYATIIRASDSLMEIVKVTNVSGATWTVQRAQDGTTALAFSAGDRVELRLTKGALNDLQTGQLLNIQYFEIS